MKKIYRNIILLLTSLFGIFALVACGNDSNKLSEEEVKANFNDEVSKGVSKQDINSYIGEAVSAAKGSVDVSALENLSLQNTKLSCVAYSSNEDTETTQTLIEAYAWQKNDIVYAGYGDSVYKVNLGELKEILNSLDETTTTTQSNVDYVSLILSTFTSSSIDVDSILSLLTFTGDDFTYSDGYFTLKKEAVVAKIATLSGKPTEVATLIYDQQIKTLEIKLGYDGYHFTAFVLNLEPKLTTGTASLSVKAEFGYENDKIVSGKLSLDYKSSTTIASGSETSSVKVELSFSSNSLVVSGEVESETVKTGKINATFRLTAKDKTLSLTATVKAPETVGTSGSFTLGAEQTAEITLKVTSTSITGSAKLANETLVTITGTVANDQITSLEATVFNVNGILDSMGVTKVVVTVTEKDVTIPSELVAKEEAATDIFTLFQNNGK